MSSKIDIVFDVDGVWNAFPPEEHALALGRPWPPTWGWDCDPTEVRVHFNAMHRSVPVTYSTGLVERVHQMVARDDVSAYWLTTWLENAPQILCPAIGLSGQDWPVLGTGDFLGREGWWKHPAIQRHVEATDHRVVWIDDDLAFDTAAQQWVAQVNADGPRLLGIAPETHVGLTLSHLELIERWIDTGEVDQ